MHFSTDPSGNGQYSLDLSLQLPGPGTYSFIVVANSIASPVSAVTITAELQGAPSTAQKVVAYLVSAGLFLLAAGIGLGNSRYHGPWWSWIGSAVCVLGLVLTAVVLTAFPAQRGLLYFLFAFGLLLFVIIIVSQVR